VRRCFISGAYAALALALSLGPALAQTSAAPAQVETVAAVVEQPRPFGYVIGDLLTQRVLLEGGSRTVQPAALPAGGRLGIWFERRSAQIERRPDGRRWLRVDYQIVNAPQSLRTIRLPAWDLKTKSPAPTLHVADWPISVGPLTRADLDSEPTGAPSSGGEGVAAPGPVRLRPDRSAPMIPTAALQGTLALWSGALGVTLAAWLAWLLWRNHTEAASLPFARALREIRHTDESTPEAWQALHRAFDGTVGRVVQLQSLPALFVSAPYLEPLRARIEVFFAQSSERFFSGAPPSQLLSTRALCSDLRRLEKRNQR
jgi:mxaA protein